MRLSWPVRLLLVLAVLLGLIALAGGAVSVAGSLAEIWDRLRAGPVVVFWGLLAFLAALAGLAGWVVWRLLVPRRRRRPVPPPVDEAGLLRRLEAGREAGVDVAAAERELAELARRREAGRLYLCLMGEVSTGKSTLVRALVPGSAVEVGVEGGTTREIRHYRWTTPGGDEVLLADVPGTGDEAVMSDAAMEEAVRAHVVVYVSDGDLSRSQYEDLEALAALGKPLVLALNKADHYEQDALETLVARLRARLDEAGAGPGAEVATVSARGAARLREVEGGGGRELETPDVSALRRAIQRQVDRSPEALEASRDTAVFRLVAHRLEAAEAARRDAEAAGIVRGYTRKAVIGALAAVTPGMDVVIQGALGTGMVRGLCRVYQVPASDIEIGRLLELSQSYVGRTLPILLAVAGNALKAFPGAGTIAGGLTHAVAYGLIFDALGRGLMGSLAEGGELRPAAAARRFRESLGEDLRSRTVRIARLALEADRSRDRD